MTDLRIRPATPADVPAITAIYAHHVLHGTGTFEEEPPALDEMARRFAHVLERGWPWLAAEEEGTGAVAGYAYAGIFRDRSAYRYAGETSLYVHPDRMGHGIGGRLLAALIPAAEAAGFRRLIAVIGDSANHPSIRLHAAHAFATCGTLDQVGFKFGRPLDVVFMQRAIGGD